jgi:hypothetical protein
MKITIYGWSTRLSLACQPWPPAEHGRKELVTHADPGLAPWPPPGA